MSYQDRIEAIQAPSVMDVEKDVPAHEGLNLNEIMDTVAAHYRLTPKKQPEQIREIENEHAVIMVLDSFGNIQHVSNKFLLQSLQCAKTERVQVLETFGEPSVAFFGQRAKTYQGGGFLLEADSTNLVIPEKYRWASGMKKFYEEELAGSQLAKKGNIALIDVGNDILYGYFLSMSFVKSAQDPNKEQFSFTFLVKDVAPKLTNELTILYTLIQAGSSASVRVRYQELVSNLTSYAKKIEECEKKIFGLMYVSPTASPIEAGVANTNKYTTEYTRQVSELKRQIELYRGLEAETISEIKSMFLNKPNQDLEG